MTRVHRVLAVGSVQDLAPTHVFSSLLPFPHGRLGVEVVIWARREDRERDTGHPEVRPSSPGRKTLGPYRRCPGGRRMGERRRLSAGALSIRPFEGGRTRLRRTRQLTCLLGFQWRFS
jgi:hypothetical protein